MRPDGETHPWLVFEPKWRLTSNALLNLGEARSKCQHLAGVAIHPALAQELSSVTLIKGALATTAIEGNTLTLEEVQKHLWSDVKLPRSREYQMVEVQNVLDAIQKIDSCLKKNERIPLTIGRVCEVNESILRNTEHEPNAVPGRLRQHSVVVGGVYLAPDWQRMQELLERLCRWLDDDFRLRDESDRTSDWLIARGIVKAVVAHVYLAWIHPFGDGNGRTARLVEVQVLSQAGVPLIATSLLSDHYNRTRDRYYRELAQASKNGGDLSSFIAYAVEGFVDGLREQINEVKSYQIRVAWENYVHKVLDGATPAIKRRRQLVLDLPVDKPTPKKDLSVISERVRNEYRDAGERTIPRDLNALVSEKLLLKTSAGYLPNLNLIRAFIVPAFSAE
jgi:Fic family protein